MTPELKNAIRHMREWDYRQGDHFDIKLYDLIAKADGANRERLGSGFPHHVEAFELRNKEGVKVYNRIGRYRTGEINNGTN